MSQAEITGISPFFIVSNVPSSLSFYRDGLGFEVTFQGPSPDDIFFGIVRRGGAQILLKDVGVAPLPNYKRDVGKGFARWDAFVKAKSKRQVQNSKEDEGKRQGQNSKEDEGKRQVQRYVKAKSKRQTPAQLLSRAQDPF